MSKKSEVIYLTSNGSLDLYPHNNACNFTNNISPHISLDNNKEYEVGLASILFPNRFYAILRDDDTYKLTFTSTINGHEHRYQYTSSENILAGDMSLILKTLNHDIYKKLAVYLGNYNIDTFIKFKTLFSWNGNNVVLQRTTGQKLTLAIQFSHNMGRVLGFRSDVQYTFHDANKSLEGIVSTLPASPVRGLDYVYIYTDIVQPTHFGGQLLNILDCFVFDGNHNKGLNNLIYRPLNNTIITGVSIKLTDQNGTPIYFENGSTVTCILHLREVSLLFVYPFLSPDRHFLLQSATFFSSSHLYTA